MTLSVEEPAAAELRLDPGVEVQASEACPDEAARSAEAELVALVGEDGVRDRSFLDVGCGGGAYSRAALALGARSVVGFDADPEAVNRASALRARQGAPATWTVETGSVLDAAFLGALPRFEVVCAWSVLDRTGDLDTALERAAEMCRGHGALLLLAVASERPASAWMARIRRVYQAAPRPLRPLVRGVSSALGFRSGPEQDVREPGVDARDPAHWPIEYARVESVIERVLPLGFELVRLRSAGPEGGVHRFAFRRTRVKPWAD